MIRVDEPPQLPPLNIQPDSFSSLPDEIVENILARISKWNYPNLSLVSKRFLSLLSSPQIYTTRSRIGATELCIYFFIQNLKDGLKWFTLWSKHSHVETVTDDDDLPCNEYSLVPITESSLEPFMHRSCSVVVGSEIYLFGVPSVSSSSEQPSSIVHILDCRSHTWRDGPNMLVSRSCPHAVVIDEKIYVMDGCGEDDTWMEVLDMKTKTWSPLLRHRANVLNGELINTVVLEGKIYAITATNYYAYDPKEGTWEVTEILNNLYNNFGYIVNWCVIEDVIYTYAYVSGNIIWYDSKCQKWIDLKVSNLELLRNRTGRVFRVVNHGGNLLVWLSRFEESDGIEKRRIWCAKIVLEKRHGNEVWGEIEWAVTEVKLPELTVRFNSLVISI